MLKFSLQTLPVRLFETQIWQSKHISNIWWTHKSGLKTCLDRQICVWSIWTGEIWSKSKENIWSFKHILKLSKNYQLGNRTRKKSYPFKSVKELMHQHAYRHSLLDSFHSLKKIFDWIRSTIVMTLRGLPAT